MTDMRVGLVLSGGGAKGAYQVGVVKALGELGARVDAVAGASIGALNGAILASAPSLIEGARRLEKLWNTLATHSPIEVNSPNYLELLLAFGMHLNGLGYISQFAKMIVKSGYSSASWLQPGLQIINQLDAGVVSTGPLHQLMDEYLDSKDLIHGLPLYISVFRSHGAILDVLSCMASEIGFLDNHHSEFLHIQSLAPSEQRKALLASAAIPMLFPTQEIQGVNYSDGGLGDWRKRQGNTPITPLLQDGCNMVIVSHLTDGSLWSRHDFPQTTILEIRPQTTINREGGIKDLLGFNAEKIPSWIEQGYQDTMHSLQRVMTATHASIELSISEKAFTAQQKIFGKLDQDLAVALERLR